MQLKSSTTLRSGKPIRRPFSSQGRAPASRSGGRPGRPGRLTCDAATPSDGSGLPSSRLTAKERIKQDILGYLEAGKDADDASQAQPREHPPGSGSNGAHGASTGISPSPSGAAEVPQTLEPGSWEWWGAYFSTMDDTVRELDGIYEEMVAAVDEEDYAKAAALREHKARLERMDAVSTVLDDLNTALEEERYSDASTLRDAGGAGFMGWWVGRMESDPYGHLLYISPDFGRYVAHAYSGVNIAELAGFTDEALTSQFGVEAATEPQDNGTAVFEVFVRRDADGMYTQQAAALHAPPGVAMPADILGDLTSLLAAQVGDAGSVSVERGEGEDGVGFVRINIGTPPDESEGGARAQESSADGADEDSDDDISTVDDLLAWMGSEEDGVPTTEIVMEGGQIRSIGAAPVEDEEENEAEGGSGMDQAGEVWMEVDGELRRVGLDEALAGAVGQQSGDATPGTQGSDAAEFMSDDASESQDTLSSMGIAVMAHRVPATIEWKGRDAFSMIIAKPDSDDDSEEEEHEESTAAAAAVAAGEEAQQIEVTSSDEEDGVEIDIQIVEASSQEASTPTAGSEVDVEAAKDGAKPAFSGRLDEIESIVRSAMGAAIAQGTGATASGGDEYGLTGRVEYTRLPTIDAPTDVFSGIYIGSFGPHGPEVLHVHRTMVDGEEWVYGTKLTGDPNIPAGKVSFRARIGREHKMSPSGVYPMEYGIQKRYKGQGQVAREGFSSPKWVDGELLTFSASNPVMRGAELGFVFDVDSQRKFLLLFTKVKLDALMDALHG